jgi:hypothetical protein
LLVRPPVRSGGNRRRNATYLVPQTLLFIPMADLVNRLGLVN